jgi:hypothetical protein
MGFTMYEFEGDVDRCQPLKYINANRAPWVTSVTLVTHEVRIER